jgi:hypothetical protein
MQSNFDCLQHEACHRLVVTAVEAVAVAVAVAAVTK